MLIEVTNLVVITVGSLQLAWVESQSTRIIHRDEALPDNVLGLPVVVHEEVLILPAAICYKVDKTLVRW